MKCHFDASVLLCKGAETLDCLTQPQLSALETLYAGAKDGNGKVFFPGFSMGFETGWREWVVGEDPGSSLGARFVKNDFRYLVSGDPKLNILTVDVDTALHQSRARTAADLDASNTDLSGFADRGGKLILYHGWNDAAISPWNTIAYYKNVQEKIGCPKSRFVCPSLHGPGNGTLRRRSRSKLIRAVWAGDCERPEVRTL